MSAARIMLALLLALSAAAQEGEEEGAQEGEARTPEVMVPAVVVGALDAPIVQRNDGDPEELLEQLLNGRDKVFARAWESWPLLGQAGIPTVVQALRDDEGQRAPLLYQLLDRIVLAHAEQAGGRGLLAEMLLTLAQEMTAPVAAMETPVFEVTLPGFAGMLEAAARYRDALPEPVVADLDIQKLQRELIWRAGLLATPAQVNTLVTLAEDTALRDTALQALGGIRGEAARDALLDGIEELDAPRQLVRIHLLTRHHPDAAQDGLRRLARESADARVVAEALDALAEFGIPPQDLAPLGEAAALLSEETMQSAALRAAQARLAQGDTAGASALFLGQLGAYTHQYQIRAALIGLLEAGSPKLQSVALAHASAQDLRPTVIDVLARDTAPDADAQLRSAWERGTPAIRTTLVEVFARRGTDDFAEMMVEAGDGDNAELRFRAAQQEGITLPAFELMDLARNGAPAVRTDALRSFLDLAFAEAISGNLDAAADQFRAVLDGPFPESSQREALEGLGMTGSPPIDFDRIRSFLYRPAHHNAAAAALIQLAAQNPDPDAAIADIQEIIEVVDSSEVLSLAAGMLEALGGDAAPMVLQQGFIMDWQLLGPFSLAAIDAHPEVFSRVIRRRLRESVVLADESYDWNSAVATGVPAVVDLDQDFPESDGDVIFASTRLPVPEFAAVVVNLFHDGGVRLWLNGKPAGESAATVSSPQRFELLLKAGVNRLMIQLLRGDGPWSFGVQLTDRRYQPLNLSAQEMPADAASGVGLSLDAIDRTITEETP